MVALEGHVAVATAADPSSAVPDVQDAPKEPGLVSPEGVMDGPEDAPGNSMDGFDTTISAPLSKLPTRMYFLRVPKPDLSERQLDKQHLDNELAQYKDACNRALAAAKLANEHRYQRREEYQASFAQFGVSKADREALLSRLKPLRDVNKQVSDRKHHIQERKSQLPASSIAHLNAKIEELEWKQAHETMDRKDENNLIAEIKKLNKSRADVARFEAEYQQVEATKDEVSTFKMSKAELEDQLKIVHEEYTLAKTQMDERWALLQEARASQETVSNEYQRLKEIKDEKFKERNACRDELQAAPNQYYENRRFSQKVRTLIGNGEAEEAVELCCQVTEVLIEELLTNPVAYRDYVSGWELQRKYAVSEVALNLDLAAPAKGKAKGKAVAPVKATSDADAIVAGIMAELDGRGPAPAAADALATTTAPVPVATAARAAKAKKVAATFSPTAHEVAHAATTTTTTNASDEPPAVKAKAAAKARSVKAAPAGAGVDIDDTFVPPASAANGAAPMLTEKQRKEAVRTVQAAKAAVAEQRKRKLEERKVKKAEQAKEVMRMKAEEEERKHAADKARIEREAQKQREISAKKKEAEAQRTAKAAEKSKFLKSRGSARAGAMGKAPPTKTSGYQHLRKWLKDNMALTLIGVVCLFLMVIVLSVVSAGK